MGEPHWERPERKKQYLRVILGCIFIGGAAVLFVRNNPELWNRGSGRTRPRETGDAAGRPAGTAPHDAGVARARQRGGTPPAPRNSESAPPASAVTIPGIRCKTADRPDLDVVMGCVIRFEPESARDEILFKRRELRVVTRKRFSTLRTDDIRVNEIRPVLVDDFNEVLERGRIRDIELYDFRIEKAGNL